MITVERETMLDRERARTVSGPRYVLLAPHNDDETLFASFLTQWHQPDLVVCLRSFVQQDRGAGIHYRDREQETSDAWEILSPGKPWVQWGFPDSNPNWDLVDQSINSLSLSYDHAIIPAVEDNGHEHHNRIGVAAAASFGEGRVTRYLTYTRTNGRSRGEPVAFTTGQVQAKLRALACYRTQIEEPSTRAHFLGPLDEYVDG